MTSKKGWIFENVISLGAAILLVLMIRSSVVEAYKIPSGSMIPTLLVGDHIFVNKFSFGWKIPFSDCTGGPKFVGGKDKPKRGDIIVFIFPKDPTEVRWYHRLICPIFGDPRTNYIKRVVGVPGDTVEVRNKTIYINSNAIASEPVDEETARETLSEIDQPQRYNPEDTVLTFEQMQENERFIRMVDRNSYFTENFAPMKVPEGQYFVMGDNRDHSNDSRFWGFVPEENIKGRAMVIWLSLWLGDRETEASFRPWRVGTILH